MLLFMADADKSFASWWQLASTQLDSVCDFLNKRKPLDGLVSRTALMIDGCLFSNDLVCSKSRRGILLGLSVFGLSLAYCMI